MTPLSCTTVLEQLEAFYDGELPVDRQIAVSSHLDRCESCGSALADFESLGVILRAAAPGRVPLPCDEAAGQVSAIVNRIKVENDASLAMRVRELFDDRHILYAGFGAAAATVACLVIMLGMMRFGTKERSDSLAGMLNVLSLPGPEEHLLVIRPVVVDARVMMPMALDSTFSSGEFDDEVLALSGVVTTEGRLANVAVLDASCSDDVPMAASDAKRYERLVDAVSRAQFEPVMKEGNPVAVNMVWFVANTTVRGHGRKHIRSAHSTLGHKQIA
jgi:putative zinc finger protein